MTDISSPNLFHIVYNYRNCFNIVIAHSREVWMDILEYEYVVIQSLCHLQHALLTVVVLVGWELNGSYSSSPFCVVLRVACWMEGS